MMDEWQKICKMQEDCEGCPLEDFCAQKPCYWDIDELHRIITDLLCEEDD
jgi:hypothetical protein